MNWFHQLCYWCYWSDSVQLNTTVICQRTELTQLTIWLHTHPMNFWITAHCQATGCSIWGCSGHSSSLAWTASKSKQTRASCWHLRRRHELCVTAGSNKNIQRSLRFWCSTLVSRICLKRYAQEVAEFVCWCYNLAVAVNVATDDWFSCCLEFTTMCIWSHLSSYSYFCLELIKISTAWSVEFTRLGSAYYN